MSIDRELLARYLRQRRELGERELFLDSLTADELRRLLEGGEPARGGTVAAEHPPETAPARSTSELAVLGDAAAGCTSCGLAGTRGTVVFGEGSPTADVVVVGEAPGAEEDRTGRPFVGPAGRLLELMLQSVGLPRSEVYICNVLKCRPPGNRDPQPDEIATCTPFLHRQLELIAPKVLLAVGKFAGQLLTRSDAPIGQLRGRVHVYQGIPLVASYHPAFLLRSPQWIRSAWQDFQLLRQVLDEQE